MELSFFFYMPYVGLTVLSKFLSVLRLICELMASHQLQAINLHIPTLVTKAHARILRSCKLQILFQAGICPITRKPARDSCEPYSLLALNDLGLMRSSASNLESKVLGSCHESSKTGLFPTTGLVPPDSFYRTWPGFHVITNLLYSTSTPVP